MRSTYDIEMLKLHASQWRALGDATTVEDMRTHCLNEVAWREQRIASSLTPVFCDVPDRWAARRPIPTDLSRSQSMTDTERSIEELFDLACRARRLAHVVSNDRVCAELVKYAEELEAEIDRRAVLD